MRPRLQTVAIRLALIAYLVCALVPARGLVVCFETDGTIALELQRVAAACEPCPDDDAHAATPSDRCACVDVPLPSHDDGFAPTPTVVRAAVAAPATALRLWPPADHARGPAAPARAAPRPAPELARIRTVVLRV